jgi:cytochrome c
MRSVLAAAAAALLMLSTSPADAQNDEYDGLPPGEGRDLVYAYCGACHSNKLVAQQGLNRERWDKLLVWMVEEQGMYPIEEPERTQVLDYLATYLGEDHR